MRLPPSQINMIKTSVTGIDPEARVFLFGSRINDSLKGGDIDLLVLSNRMDFSMKIELKFKLLEQMDEQKIDIVIKKNQPDPFVDYIYPDCVEL